MQLELTRYRQPLDHFSRTFQPAGGGTAGRQLPGGRSRSRSSSTSTRTRIGSGSRARSAPSWSCRAAAAWNRSGCRSTRPSICGICRPRRCRAAEDSAIEEEDLETSYYRDDQIDLNELLREQFYLALPMKPLCQDGCRGLCPQCGTNLNQGACDCAPEWKDPRLARARSDQEKPEQCLIPNDDIPRRARPSGARTTR